MKKTCTAHFFHEIKYYIHNLKCLATISLHKYNISLLYKKHLEQYVFKTLTPDISVPYWCNRTPSSTYVFN